MREITIRIIAVLLAVILIIVSLWVTVDAGSVSSSIVSSKENTQYEEKVQTYIFYNENGETINSQKLIPGEYLLEPPAPYIENRYFTGWQVKDSGKQVRFPYKAKAEDGKRIEIEPIYRNQSYIVKYMAEPKGSSGNQHVIATQFYEKPEGGLLDTGDISFSAAGSSQTAIGWQYQDSIGKWKKTDENTLVKENMTLYPVIEDVSWIVFDTAGGTFIDPEYYVKGSNVMVENLPTPEKEGWTFDGWYIGENRVEGKIPLSGNKVCLTAHWKEAQALVAVVIWKQQRNDQLKNMPKFENLENRGSWYEDNTMYEIPDSDKNYSFDSTINIKVPTESILKLENLEQNSNIKKAIEEKGFKVNTVKQKTQDGKNVKGDGSTIYNIYMDRDIITYYVEYHPEFIRYSHDSTVGFYQKTNFTQKYLVYKGLYQDDFPWPEVTDGHDADYFWLDTSGTTAGFTGEPVYCEFSFDYSKNDGSSQVWFERRRRENAINSYPVLVHNMIETEDGSWEDRFVSVTMIAWNIFKRNYYMDYTFEDTIPGYHGESYEMVYSDGSSEGGVIPQNRKFTKDISEEQYDYENPHSSGLYVYYKRNTYNLICKDSVNGSVKIGGEKIPYKYMDRITKPSSPSNSQYGKIYTFAGFYKDSRGKSPYKFDGKMPAHDVIVYRVWKPKEVTVTFDPSGGKVSGEKKINLKAGEMIPKAEIPVPVENDNMRFGRWEKDGKPFSFETKITEDTVLKAHWIGDEANIRVEYCDGNKFIVEKDLYSAGNKIELRYLSEIEDDWGKNDNFIGWMSSLDDEIYYPGQPIDIQEPENGEKTIRFMAVWGKTRKGQIHFIKGSENMMVETRKINEPLSLNEIINIDEGLKAKLTSPDIVGWTLKEGTEEYISSDEKLYVNTLNNSNNKIYCNRQEKSSINISMSCKDMGKAEVTLSLKDESGNPYSGSLFIGGEKVDLKDGKAFFTMKDGDEIELTGYLRNCNWEVTAYEEGYRDEIKNGRGRVEQTFVSEKGIYLGANEKISIEHICSIPPATGIRKDVPVGTILITVFAMAFAVTLYEVLKAKKR